MKAQYSWFNLLAFLFIYALISTASASPDDPAACDLDLSSYNYLPSGLCIGKNEKVILWGSIPSTLCCRNALNTFSQTVALHANRSQGGDIFISKDQLNKCNNSFLKNQEIVDKSCISQDFFYGSNVCSNLTTSGIQDDQSFRAAVASCSGLSSSDFVNTCKKCTFALVPAMNNQMETSGRQKDDFEATACALAVVVAVAATNVDNHAFVDLFFSCLSALDVPDPGAVKLNDSLVKGLVAVFVAFVILMLILTLIRYVTLNKTKNKKSLPKPPVLSKQIMTWSGLYTFSKAEIENAINFAGGKEFLGRGSAGQVYKGVVPSGQAVAIKHINKSNSDDSFTREVEGLSRIRHPNLVCLFGCCIEGGEQYLVYEYCSSGNLAQHLLRKDTFLTWKRRVKILRDCALALRYLHRHIDGCIVHRDVKLTNILLTQNMEAKLSDFGLARMLGMKETKVFTDVRGTIGYMDPEYMTTAKLTSASDIYSFGIVILQILSGQKVIELDLHARDQLTRKAKDVSTGKRSMRDFEDSRLNGDLNRADFESILQVAVLCVARSSKGRPSIEDVFEVIEKAWKNIVMVEKNEMDSSAALQPDSIKVITVRSSGPVSSSLWKRLCSPSCDRGHTALDHNQWKDKLGFQTAFKKSKKFQLVVLY